MVKTLIFLLCLFVPFSAYAAAPTLEAAAASAQLRITDGTFGDPVTWNDVWNWDDGGGSSAGDGDVPIDGGGTAKVNTFITETVVDAVYIILKDIWFGNATDATYFQSLEEMVYFVDTATFRTTANASLSLGKLYESWGHRGSMWNVKGDEDLVITVGTNADFYLYASLLHLRRADYTYLSSGNLVMKNSIVSGEYFITDTNFRRTLALEAAMTSVDINKCFFTNLYSPLRLKMTPTLSEYHAHRCQFGIEAQNTVRTATNPLFTSMSVADIFTNNNGDFIVIDPQAILGSILINTNTSWVEEKFSTNIHVVDKNGTSIETANVTCNDVFGTSVFDVNTDVNGDISEQAVISRRWIDQTETLTNHNPHTFVISRVGYRTQTIIYNYSDGKVNWEVELDDGDTVIYDSTIYDSTIY